MSDNRTNNSLHFMKWHGAGNDFVIIDSRGPKNGAKTCVTEALAREMGNRHTGVGFDQLAEIHDSDAADIDLDFWNSDGSRAGACGNATRCVARYIMDDIGVDTLTLRTTRGVLLAQRTNGEISVNMGQPQLDWTEIPLVQDVDLLHLPIDGDPVAVGMGNPHCVFFVDDADAVDVAEQGSALEHHSLYPEATNVEFVQVRAPDEIRLRVWERGTGITLACGSGACASVVATARRGLTGRKVRVQADGGWLSVDWRDDGVWLSGPTKHVFNAVFKTKNIAG